MNPAYDALYASIENEDWLDVDKPADRALYVSDLHKSDGINPADEMLLQMQRARGGGTWFFTGHRGVGKSTELRRVAHVLRASGHFVVVADMNDYLNLAEPVSIELLLLTMMGVLANGYERRFGGQPLQRGVVARLVDFLRGTEVTLDELKATFGGDGASVEAGFTFKDNPVLREKIVRAVQGALGNFVGEVRKLASEVVAMVDRARPGTKVVVILDSLERLRVSGIGADERFDAVQKTFEVYSAHLKFDDMLVVYSIPPYLPYLVPRLGALIGAKPCTLPHVKVFHAPAEGSDRPYQPGLDHMLACLLRRDPGAEQVIERRLLERLALASSGGLRDFFRLVRTVCTKAPLAGADAPLAGVAGERWIAAAEQELRSEMPLTDEDLTWLAKVRATHGPGLAELGDLPKLARLFDTGVVLSYRNSEDWCDVQYLLRQRVAEHAAGAGAGP